MKLTGELKDKVDKAESMEAKKDIIAEAGMELTDEGLEGVSGGLYDYDPERDGFRCELCRRTFTNVMQYSEHMMYYKH